MHTTMEELMGKTEQTKEKEEVWHLVFDSIVMHFTAVKPNVKLMRSLITSSRPMRRLRCILVSNIPFERAPCITQLHSCAFMWKKICLKCIQLIRKSTVRKETESRKQTRRIKVQRWTTEEVVIGMWQSERHDRSFVIALPLLISFSSSCIERDCNECHSIGG